MRALRKAIVILAFFCLWSAAGQVPAAAQGWANGCLNRRAITIDHTKVPNTDQANFPVLISGTYAYLATTANGGNVTNANGYDILFASDANGVNPLPFEQESYNASTGAIVYWVKLSTMSHTVDTVFYLFYGNSSISANQSNPTALWDNSYKGVWHLPNGASLTANDSTSNGNNGTITGATATNGAVDGAASLSGSGQYIDVGNLPSLQITGNALTIETWIKTSEANPSQWERIVVKETSGNQDPYSTFILLRYAGTNLVNFGRSTGGAGTAIGITSASSLTMGAWTHLVGTYDGSQLKIYFNGNLDGQVSATGNIVATNQNVVIGADTAGGGENFNGSIDEVRISNSARSADWIATEYKNQSSPSTFYSVGSAAQGTMTLSITGLSPGTANPGEAVVIQGTNFAATQGGSTVSLNGTSLAVQSWSDTAINVIVPFGAAAGYFTVAVNGQTAVSPIFNLRRIPLGWSDGDIGTVGKAGSAGYASGTFTVNGAGQGMSGSADQLHYLYQPLSGDGTIVARVVSMQGGNYPQAGVMIRESLGAGAANIYPAYYYTSYMYVFQRSSTGASSTGANYVYTPLPYWVKVTRSGNTFSSYASGDGVNWAQMGTSQTITIAQNAYIGLAVSSGSTTVLTTATFDNVSVSSTAAPAPVITSVSATTGSIGSQVLISGSGFGASQGGSGVTLNRAPATINSWSNTSITITIPSGATSGPLLVTLAPSMNDSNAVEFTVTTQPLPSSWLDQDVGTVGTSGSASYANGTFTMAGSGQGLNANADGLHFVYQPMSGDGTIVARLASLQGSVAQAGVMIRETLDPGATLVSEIYNRYFSYLMLYERPTTGASISAQNGAYSTTLPYWVKLVRSGNTFTGYTSTDGVNWVQSGTSVTVSMAQNVYIGLMVSSTYTTTLATATFDSVSISSTASPAPAITAVSTTTGSVGSQVLITGTGFGASQGGSQVEINNTPMTINSWSSTSIVFTIPSGASSGPLLVSVAPSMNDSNVVAFTVTSHPLLTPWLDRDIGSAGIVGSASYSNGTFTVNAAGQGIQAGSTADSFHFVYQPLSGDGTIVARVVSFSSPNSSATAGVMIRETLDPRSTNADTGYWAWYNSIYFEARVATGVGNSQSNGMAGSAPYWVKVVRTGSTFSGYASLDAVNWTQVGSNQTISMAQNVYVGLAVSNGANSALGTATFDSVSISSTAAPAPVITSVSATTGSIGSQVVIRGTGFGASEGSSLVLLNSAPASINSWSNTSITITIPAGATSGPLLVSVAPSMNDSNAVNFTVSSQPLLIPWVDQDIGLVGIAGSASYANGTFTVKGAGQGTYNTSDGFHFVYQTLSGDGTIVARVASIQGGSGASAGVLIRETLDPAARSAFEAYYASCCIYLWARTTPGTSAFNQADVSVSLPYWVKLIRSGSAFSTYGSTDGAVWTQLGSTVTITMAQSVYVGLAVSNGSTSALATATFDNVSLTVGSTPFVTGVSPSVGGTGTAVTIAGSNFGTTPGDSTVSFNGALAASITSWSSTQIVANVSSATAAGTGPVIVTVNSISSPSGVTFTMVKPTINSLTPPAAQVGASITLNGTGFGPSPVSDPANFNVKFNGVAANVSAWSDTTVTAAVPSNATSGPVTLTQNGITSNGVQFTVSPPLSVTSVSPSIGPAGTSVTITGTGFGATQSNSVASFYGATAAVTSWSDTQIVAVVPAGAGSGSVSVEVGSIWYWGPSFTLTFRAQITDSLGNPSTYIAASIGGNWVTASSQGSGCSSCTGRGTISYTYDNQGHTLSKTDENGNATSYTYDSNGNVLTVTVPIDSSTSATTTYTYNSFGEVLTTTDPLGNVTTNTYDSHGNLLTVTTPAPNGSTSASVTTFTYDSKGELLTITDPRNNKTTIAYFPTGLIQTITDAQNNVTTYGYDAHGNRTSVKDANNQTTTFGYDTGDRLKTITYPGSTGTTAFTYDNRGRRTSVTDQNGKTTTYAYDDADRLTSVTDAATPGNVTTYGYDTENNLTSIQDANSHTTSFSYDAFGRVTKTTFPSGYIETYGYDAVGNLLNKTDRKNQLITYTYDQLNRLTQKTYPDTTAVNYTYDNDSRLTQVTDPTGTYQFTFDNMGRLTNTTTSYAFLAGRNFTTSYGYDAASNRTGFTDPENGATSYAYDTLNRLQTLTPPTAFSGTGSFGLSYDALSRRTQMTRPNGLKSIYAYDNLSRLLSVLHQSGSTTLDGASYVVDNAGNRTSKTDQLAGVTSNYTYDPIYELTQVTQAATTTESYTYDPVGNRLSSLGVSPYTNNTSNELTSIPGTTYTYDLNGNTLTSVTGSNTTTYAWDFENRLSSVTLPGSGGTVAFKYDPFGRRVYKSSSSGTSIYAYDGDNLVEETNASGAAVARYAQNLNIDEPLAMLRNGATSFYNADALGSITSLANGAGSLAQTYSYDSFGKSVSSSGSVTNPFQYTARELDPETNLYYYRARYYDTASGRFIGEDPLAFNAGLNFYNYVNGNPTNLADPKGLFGWGDVLPAWNHYCDGTGTPWSTPFASINWGNTQSDIEAKVKGMVGGGCSDRTIPVSFSMNAQTAGADAYIIGRHIVKVTGTIKVSCNCSWSFTGDMSSKPGYDPYDFDPSNRGAVGETLTWMGAHRCTKKGRPFNINLPGSSSLSAGGKIDGKPTCDKCSK